MLDPWIIEEIRRREEDKRREEEDRGRINLPIPPPHYQDGEPSQPSRDDEGGRGVTVIDL